MTKAQQFPEFTMQPQDVVPKITHFIEASLAAHEELKKVENPTFKSLDIVEEVESQFGLFMNELSHILGVCDVDNAFMEEYEKMIPEFSIYGAKLGQDKDLYAVYKKISETELTEVERRVIDRELLAFKNSGIDLAEDKQARLLEVNTRLSELSSKFGNNAKNDSNELNIDLVDDSRLVGITEVDKSRFARQAEEVEGVAYRIKTNFPDRIAVLEYAEDKELRKEVFMNSQTIATPRNGVENEYDNTEIVKEIITLRQEKAELLGYANYAELSLSKKMAETPAQVVDFLEDLTEKATNQYHVERKEVKDFAVANGFVKEEETLEPWDSAIVLRLMTKERFNIDEEKVKEYFPISKVLDGLFWTIKELFGYDVKQVDFEYKKYVDELQLFEIKKDGELVAYIYGDFFARTGKRSGAWMADYTERTEDTVPVAFVTCNYPMPEKGKESLLSFNEVVTTFHEFGHALHHTLTKIDTKGAAGIEGVPWDAVELPSTFMEFFCSKPQVLAKISSHVETGETLPQEMVDSLIEAEHFCAAIGLMRQMEFSLADMIAHKEGRTDIQKVADEFREKVGMPLSHRETSFFNNFGHIFAGGYAAGYYSYKWADILASDIFETFDENGVICRETGERYLNLILSQGSSREIMDMFRDFKGSEPRTEPFLKYSGIKAA
jgi:oligopeptidase A